jgi:hypothetical protein
MSDRRCAHCAKPLPTASRSDRVYCSATCRVAAHEARQRRARVELLEAEHVVDHDAVEDPLERLRAVVDEAIVEPRLLGVVAAAAGGGN